MKTVQDVDKQDFNILTIIAAQPRISSWDICRKIFPDEDNPQNHLSSVIWRLDKLTELKFIRKQKHPTREHKAVYSLPDLAFSVDGTIFIPSPAGGIIINCTYINGCKPHCKFGGRRCKLATAILSQGLEPVVKISEVLAKMRDGLKKEGEKKWEAPLPNR